MIATLGIFSIFQLTLLPGLIIVKLLKFRGFWETLLLSIGISPIFNYAFVMISTILGIYTRFLTLSVFILEILLVLYLYFPELNQSFAQITKNHSASTFFQGFFKKDIDKPGQWLFVVNSIYLMVFILAAGGVLFYIKSFAFPSNSTFVSWDAVVSWDRWAKGLYHMQLPQRSYHYPQLISANWSLTYQFIGEERVKLFIKAFMGLIEVFVPLTSFALGIIKRDIRYFFGTFFICLLQAKFGSLCSGYVDTAVAFYALLAIVFLFLARDHEEKIRFILIGALFAAGAALTKQAGFWIVINYILLVVLQHGELIKQKSHHLLEKIILIDLVTIMPWYIYKEVQIRMGLDTSEIHYVTTLGSQGKTALQVLTTSFDQILLYLNNPVIPALGVLFLLIVLLLFSFKDIFWRKILGLVIFPYLFIWIFFFSYDIRNLNLIIPLIGLVAGVGLQNILKISSVLEDNFNPISILDLGSIMDTVVKRVEALIAPYKPMVILPFIVIPIFLLPILFSNASMIEKSIEDQKMNVDSVLNQMLYEYHDTIGFEGKILTEYQILGYLPGLEEFYLAGDPKNIKFIEEINQPEATYVLTNMKNMAPEVKILYDQLVLKNQFEPIFTYGPYQFNFICHSECK